MSQVFVCHIGESITKRKREIIGTRNRYLSSPSTRLLMEKEEEKSYGTWLGIYPSVETINEYQTTWYSESNMINKAN